MTFARYTFLPWLRRGIANQLQSPAGAGKARATLNVELTAQSDRASTPLPAVPVMLVGPGDITGVNPLQVIRTEPRPLVTDYEPNYFACIDLYDEDFPWRYSPLAPDTGQHRLPPWITLIVLKDDEYTRKTRPGRAVAAIELKSSATRDNVFPAIGQEYAWAHVHLNEALGSGTAPDLARLAALLAANPDAGYARLVSPRKLEPKTAYTAFVVPTFEVGRKAGLGETVADTDDGLVRSWVGPANEFPVLYEWRFATGVDGDFESLVRALVPRDMDPRVGIREMSIATPGFGMPSATNPPDDEVGLEGALLAPTTVRKGLVATSDFVPQIVPILNAPADARTSGSTGGGAVGSDDPIVSPPIHGAWHAAVERVAADGTGWVDGLNLDPRYRAAAGLGARVVRKHQERYMRLAWEQIGDVVRVNHAIRRLQLATKASNAAYLKTMVALPETKATAIAAPTFAKIMGSPVTLRAMTNASRLPRAALSPALRKQLRPRGLTARRLLPAAERQHALATVIEGINDGTLSTAPPPPAPGGATVDGTNDGGARPPWQRWLLANLWWLWFFVFLLVVIALAVAPIFGLLLATAIFAAASTIWGAFNASNPDAAVAEVLGSPRSVRSATSCSRAPKRGPTPKARCRPRRRRSVRRRPRCPATTPPRPTCAAR
jgi:hypothetical protein